MQFVALVCGILLGALWGSVIGAILHHPNAKEPSCSAQLLICFLIAVLTGLAMRGFEIHSFLAPEIAEGLSLGVMAGLMRSSWYVPRTRLLRVQGRNRAALSYFIASPVLVSAGMFGGYSYNYLSAHFN